MSNNGTGHYILDTTHQKEKIITIPYDQGQGAKELKALQEKVGPPISREQSGIEKVKYDLTPYGIYDDE